MYKHAWKGKAEKHAHDSSLHTMKNPLNDGKDTEKHVDDDNKEKKRKVKYTDNQKRFMRQLKDVAFVVRMFKGVDSNLRVTLIHALWKSLEWHEVDRVSKLIIEKKV